ncbi:hypothetical protein P8C59_000850 [Phyllachora maydis]|uniref:RNA-dependent RNA polymerase n=1 Tax=Phyllachora maydis TaxID=1825666 RepID=A0AAD9HY95_9PEZI|nr:hypothetical protein P8C59_000850 [Phyllachora maydis]
MVASELKTARLNLQFLPILEDRAIEPAVLRKALKKRFQDNLDQNLEGQKMAMDSPVQFLDWIYANEPVRWNRVRTGVNYLAGLPEDKTEILILLLNSGFDLKSQKFVRDEAFNLQKSKCEQLKTKFGVRIPCSAHVLMVVDFWGVLEEDEVHLGFSSKFQTDDAEFEDTMLHGIDVLVGRSPAHFASDIQRVKAVFKPELRTLKDCIVFSRKGDVPLADKLSGGDYDGDKAWVCWDPALVSNFDNAEVPDLARFDLVVSKYTKKDKTKYRELGNGTFHELIRKGFQFNMKHSILGAATEFKEAYLYHSLQTASSEAANLLSTLLGNLVDQSKQGIMFTWGDWLLLADYLKFEVGLPKIEEFLKNVYQSLESDVQGCRDADLEEYFKDFEVKARNSRPCARVLDKLRKDIDAVRKDWTRATAGGNDKKAKGTEWRAKVGPVYQKWCSIVPSVEMTPGKMRPATMLTQDFLPGDLHSQWALLRASTAYKYHKSNFVWHMAGRHLAEIKARMVSARAGGAPVLLVPELYAAATVDKKYVRLWAATRHEGKSLPDSGGPGGEDGEDYDDDDDDDDDDDELFGDEDTIVYHDEDGYAGP